MQFERWDHKSQMELFANSSILDITDKFLKKIIKIGQKMTMFWIFEVDTNFTKKLKI